LKTPKLNGVNASKSFYGLSATFKAYTVDPFHAGEGAYSVNKVGAAPTSATIIKRYPPKPFYALRVEVNGLLQTVKTRKQRVAKPQGGDHQSGGERHAQTVTLGGPASGRPPEEPLEAGLGGRVLLGGLSLKALPLASPPSTPLFKPSPTVRGFKMSEPMRRARVIAEPLVPLWRLAQFAMAGKLNFLTVRGSRSWADVVKMREMLLGELRRGEVEGLYLDSGKMQRYDVVKMPVSMAVVGSPRTDDPKLAEYGLPSNHYVFDGRARLDALALLADEYGVDRLRAKGLYAAVKVVQLDGVDQILEESEQLHGMADLETFGQRACFLWEVLKLFKGASEEEVVKRLMESREGKEYGFNVKEVFNALAICKRLDPRLLRYLNGGQVELEGKLRPPQAPMPGELGTRPYANRWLAVCTSPYEPGLLGELAKLPREWQLKALRAMVEAEEEGLRARNVLQPPKKLEEAEDLERTIIREVRAAALRTVEEYTRPAAVTVPVEQGVKEVEKAKEDVEALERRVKALELQFDEQAGLIRRMEAVISSIAETAVKAFADCGVKGCRLATLLKELCEKEEGLLRCFMEERRLAVLKAVLDHYLARR